MIRIDFKIIEQPNRWSCTACAFAMACGVRLEEFIKRIGHDGSEILFTDLPEPRRRRGFAVPECIKVCLEWGLTVTPVDFKPRCGPDEQHFFILEYDDFKIKMLEKYQGVIQGHCGRSYHSVGWDGKMIYDPCGDIYNLGEGNFEPEIFWIIK